MKRYPLFLVLVGLLAAQSVLAQTFAVKGVLRDPLGRTVEDGTYRLTFKLYDVDTGGTAIWSEEHAGAAVQHGVFSVELGKTTSLSGVSFLNTYYLGIAVENEEEMTPRIKLATIPYSLAVQGVENRFPSVGNVGIGNTAPGSKLSVAGDVEISGNRLHVDNGGNVGIGTATPSSKFTVDGDVEISGSRLHVANGGNVGIGTATPGSKFTVDGDVEISGNRLHVASDGNVGIGTDAPGQKLQVDGNIKLGGNGALIFPDGTSFSSAANSGSAGSVANSASALITADADGAGGGEVQLLTGDPAVPRLVVANDGKVGIGTTTPAGQFQVADDLVVDADGKVGIGTTTPLNRLYIDVPDGKDNPNTAGLTILNPNTSADDFATAHLRVQDGGGDAMMTFDVHTVNAWNIGLDNSDEDKFKFSTNWGDLHLSTRMALTQDGLLGINEDSPTNMLHVTLDDGKDTPHVAGLTVLNPNASADDFATAHFNVQDGGGDAMVTFNASGAGKWNIGLDNSDADKLKFSTNWGDLHLSTRMTLTQDGLLGINEDNPANMLQIAVPSGKKTPHTAGLTVDNANASVDDYAIGQFRVRDGGGDAMMAFSIAGGASWNIGLDNSDAEKLKFSTNWGDLHLSTRMTLTQDGDWGLGTDAPQARAHVKGSVSGSGEHLVVFENTAGSGADVLALEIDYATPTGGNNYITFYNNSGSIGAVQGNSSGGVEYKTTSADFAEYMPRLQEEETMEAGDIVGVFAGEVSHRTQGAHYLSAITDQAAMAGNWPGEEEEATYERVSFVGQVRVKVRGPVRAGDYILPSGQDDGVGVAISPARITAAELGRVVGQAWETAEDAGVKRVNAALGLPLTVRTQQARMVESERRNGELQVRVRELETRNAELLGATRKAAQRLEQIEGQNARLRARLEQVEAATGTRMARLEDALKTLEAQISTTGNGGPEAENVGLSMAR